MTQTALLIGQVSTLRRLEQQLDLLAGRPITIGWVLTSAEADGSGAPIVGTLDDLEAVIVKRKPSIALISLPGSMTELIASIRTRLRRLGVADRFMPTLEDQLSGVGPRSLLDIDLARLIDRPPKTIDHKEVRSVISNRRVLITGAGGSIGSELARIVARYEPQRLILVDRSENALFEIDRQIARAAPELPRKALLHDIVDEATTLGHFERLRPEVIFHAAAHKHVPMMEDHPGEAVDNNVFGTRSVADAAHAVLAQRFVMISTDKAVNPRSIMGSTKRLAELYVQDIARRSDTGYSMVRFGNVLGSSGSVLKTWSRQIAEGGAITVTDPRMTRFFMTIPEAAALVIQSAALLDPDGDGGEVFVLDMGEPLKIVDLARGFAEMHGLRPFLPDETSEGDDAAGSIRIVFSGARPGEKIHEELACDAEALQPTRHPDIQIWRLAEHSPQFVAAMIERLSPQRRSQDAVAVAHEIRRLVPETAQPSAA